ncbi:amidohydrolase [Dasania sp. GY-MA-18]|uniref:Amidohydrolase n=1 Tax=Dasania phycosphaerae TaxID=2950436 RepID=A0A9J6RM69_9GAMM|nr:MULTISPECIES: amidohydrolase [Dasania]MCR8922848.1 amidohydrolase [Dasania sp. GY-MA-18]MCZ0865279.1 amidohydrolase [Dasania phycosphaerae]MCZ0869004.1 amidohydrolase [Dasania phycosphaerae]
MKIWLPKPSACLPSLKGLALLLAASCAISSQAASDINSKIKQQSLALEQQVIAWRRDIHQHPELGNREFRTAKLVAEHLEKLGIEVQTGVAHTGVVGILRGNQASPVIAIRADMDALPVSEQVDLPFASKVTTLMDGEKVGVMHACGHDNHVAILMGVAELLASMRDQLPGTVKFIFQPAEEGPPPGEQGGAELMVKQGVMSKPTPDAVIGLHVMPFPVGSVYYTKGSAMASQDDFSITVKGKQTHGAMPWGGVDPIVAASQVVLGLQTVPSRQLNITAGPTIVTVGKIAGGVRSNIIPDKVEIVGTVRTLMPDAQEEIHHKIRHTAEHIAAATGAKAEVEFQNGYPVTYNNPELTDKMVAKLQQQLGSDRVKAIPASMGSEDFSYLAQKAPGFFFMLGIVPADQDPVTAAKNHSPYFYADEAALQVGVEALSTLAVDFLKKH